ncbi:MAG: hypothetical protein HYX61_10130 [Gammaproteobacteria bacterium]|nr:hypothetical protein [Gammaproteobacteria bacterium]
MTSNKLPKPFFSALTLPDVQYHQTPRALLSRFHSILYKSVTKSTINRTLTGLSFLMGTAFAVYSLPHYIGIPLDVGLLLLGTQHLHYLRAQMRKEDYLIEESPTAPTCPHPMLKDRKLHTFNHILSFVKYNGHIWYALRKSEKLKPDWKILYIDRMQLSQEQFEQLEMIADGQNLMLRVPQESHDEIYYKKVIAEERKDNVYVVENLCEEPQAIDSWFTLPFLHYFKPQQLGQRLKLAKGAKWAMSNAADYKHVIVDGRGIVHSHLPITIVYDYHHVKMHLHDPYVEEGSVYSLSLPPLLKEAEHLEASASILFAASKKSKDEIAPTLQSMYLDYDSEGLHPLISFTFDNKDGKKRLLPINHSKTHRLPVAVDDITNITALQCAHNPHSIEIRVTTNDHSGFYFKKYDEEHWYFYSHQAKTVSRKIKHHPKPDEHHSVILKSRTAFQMENHQISKVEIHDSDKKYTFYPVIFKEGKKQYHFILRRHKNLIRSFFGLSDQTWTLNPDPTYDDNDLLASNKSIPVTLTWQHDRLQLKDKDNRFNLEFKNKGNQITDSEIETQTHLRGGLYSG